MDDAITTIAISELNHEETLVLAAYDHEIAKLEASIRETKALPYVKWIGSEAWKKMKRQQLELEGLQHLRDLLLNGI
jgi:hypothetical protein